MSSINTKIIAAVACLAATTLAYPASGSSLSARQSNTDCTAPLVFYNCANGYWGCFTTDPCALPSLTNPQQPTSMPTSVPVSVPVSVPTSTPTWVPTSDLAATAVVHACPADSTSFTDYFEPEIYNLSVEDPDLSQPEPVDYIHVRTNATESKLVQAMVFRGIPANAKKCSLNWNQSAIADGRNFTVTKNGAVWVESLTGFPAAGEPISVNSVAPYETGFNSTADFTEWDLKTVADTHSIRTVDCAEELYYKLEINTVNKWGTVLFEQDAHNGIYLSYTC